MSSEVTSAYLGQVTALCTKGEAILQNTQSPVSTGHLFLAVLSL